MSWSPTPLLLVAPLALAACGEPLRDAAFPGEPLGIFDVVLTRSGGEAGETPAGARLGVLWWTEAGFVPHHEVTPAAGDGPDVRLVLHEPPPAPARAEGYAVGALVVFIDRDGDGRVGLDEPRYSAATASALVWSEAGLVPGRAPVTLPVEAGYARVDGFLPCSGPYASSGEPSCPRPVGVLCEMDEACGDRALCLRDRAAMVGEGVCAQLAPPDDPCPPAGARRVVVEEPPLGFVWVWGQACAVDADCEEPLACARGTGVCALRTPYFQMILDSRANEADFCHDDTPFRPGPPPPGGRSP